MTACPTNHLCVCVFDVSKGRSSLAMAWRKATKAINHYDDAARTANRPISPAVMPDNRVCSHTSRAGNGGSSCARYETWRGASNGTL